MSPKGYGRGSDGVVCPGQTFSGTIVDYRLKPLGSGLNSSLLERSKKKKNLDRKEVENPGYEPRFRQKKMYFFLGWKQCSGLTRLLIRLIVILLSPSLAEFRSDQDPTYLQNCHGKDRIQLLIIYCTLNPDNSHRSKRSNFQQRSSVVEVRGDNTITYKYTLILDNRRDGR